VIELSMQAAFLPEVLPVLHACGSSCGSRITEMFTRCCRNRPRAVKAIRDLL
jgi:hypothetical protein